MEFQESYSFDDLLLLPSYSNILPKDTDTSTEIVKGITIKKPFISAAMDTITESKMAIAMALSWAISCIHKNFKEDISHKVKEGMSKEEVIALEQAAEKKGMEDQVKEVEKVKKHQSFIVRNPITLTPESTIADYKKSKEKFKVSTFPVIAEDWEVIWIITNRNFQKAEEKENNKIKDIMTPKEKLITAKKTIEMADAEKILKKNEIEQLIIVDNNNQCIWLITEKDIENNKNNPEATIDDQGRLRVAAAVWVGTNEQYKRLISAWADILVVDSAHWNSQWVLDTVKYIRNNFKDIKIIWGNICEEDWTKNLIKAWVDAVKVGIWPWSICTTRVIAWVWNPQFSAINEARSICKEKEIPIIWDWGIKYSGDIGKAIAAWASCVMIGNLLAWAEETPWELIEEKGRSFKVFRWMGSIGAMWKWSADRYFQEDQKKDKLVPEWIEWKVVAKWSVKEIIHQLNGWLKATLWYTGKKDIPSLQDYKRIRKISATSLKENHPHSLHSFDDTSNYKK